MNSQHRAIRALLTTMAPRRAEAYIRAFELPEDEEALLIDCDVRKKSYAQLAEQGFSPETVKKAKRRAYAKIVDAVQHSAS